MRLNTFALRVVEAKTKNKPDVYVFDVHTGFMPDMQFAGLPYRVGERQPVATSGKLIYRVRVTRKDMG